MEDLSFNQISCLLGAESTFLIKLGFLKKSNHFRVVSHEPNKLAQLELNHKITSFLLQIKIFLNQAKRQKQMTVYLMALMMERTTIKFKVMENKETIDSKMLIM